MRCSSPTVRRHSLRASAVAAITVVFLLMLPSVANAAFWPEHGDLVYNGGTYANSYFTFNQPGPWSGSYPGYEHDFEASPLYFNRGDSVGTARACTTWTNLPDWYDDCPTAGVSDRPDAWSFSFGSYSARSIVAGRQYRGDWYFYRATGSSNSSAYAIRSQNVESKCGGLKYQWCMFSVANGSYANGTRTNVTGTLVYGQYLVAYW